MTSAHDTGYQFTTSIHEIGDQLIICITDTGDQLITSIHNTIDQFAAEINDLSRNGAKYWYKREKYSLVVIVKYQLLRLLSQ